MKKSVMTAVEHLEKAKTLILSPENWGKGFFKSPNGKRFCASGALLEVDGGVDSHTNLETNLADMLATWNG